jgi:hypothetical protein
VDIGEAVGSLRRSGGRVLGTVFVGSDRGLGYGYGPAYRYGYTAGAMTDDNGATG